MEASNSPGDGIPESSLDFFFGFDNDTYSDRTLLLHIVDAHDQVISGATTEPPVKSIQINSLILAARSRYFRNLFSNGMRESGQKLVTLWIETAEEVSLMDLLKYVYSNNLPTTPHALLNLLVIADKFEVASCLSDCTRLLQNMPMTWESASLYLDLPPSLLISPTVQPLVDAAKKCLVAHFKDFDQCKEEMLNLPLTSIQAVLSSDNLQVASEGVVYYLVLKWVHKHYPGLEERREILKTHLLDLIRFPFMTVPQLTEEVQTCNDIDRELASHIVIRALSFKAETPHGKRCLAAEEGNAVCRQFVERAYKYRSVKIVEPESLHQHCIVFLHYTREELMHIFPVSQIISETFHLGKQEFALVVGFYLEESTNTHKFMLTLKVVGLAAAFPVKYNIAIRSKAAEEFESWTYGRHVFTEQESVEEVLCEPWTELIDNEDDTYFINDILYVRAELTAEM